MLIQLMCLKHLMIALLYDMLSSWGFGDFNWNLICTYFKNYMNNLKTLWKVAISNIFKFTDFSSLSLFKLYWLHTTILISPQVNLVKSVAWLFVLSTPLDGFLIIFVLKPRKHTQTKITKVNLLVKPKRLFHSNFESINILKCQYYFFMEFFFFFKKIR